MESHKVYANLNSENYVVRLCQGDLKFLQENYSGKWIDALIDHPTKKRADIGLYWDEANEVFYDINPPDSTGYWSLNKNNGEWVNTKPKPTDRPEVKEWSWNHIDGIWETWRSAMYKTNPRFRDSYPNDGYEYKYVFKTESWQRVEYVQDENGVYNEVEVN